MGPKGGPTVGFEEGPKCYAVRAPCLRFFMGPPGDWHNYLFWGPLAQSNIYIYIYIYI